MAIWDSVETEAVRVVWCVTSIAEEKDFFLVALSTYWAWNTLFLVLIENVGLYPGRIEIGNLLLIFDIVLGKNST